MATTARKEEDPFEGQQWVTVSRGDPAMITFDAIGDVFTGIKVGCTEITDDTVTPPKTWLRWDFDAHGATEFYSDGEFCGINGTWQLDRELSKVPDGALTRVGYHRDVPTGKGNPMKSFTVDYMLPRDHPAK